MGWVAQTCGQVKPKYFHQQVRVQSFLVLFYHLESSITPYAGLCALLAVPFQVRRKPRSNLTGPKDTVKEDVEEVTFRGFDENGYENPP